MKKYLALFLGLIFIQTKLCMASDDLTLYDDNIAQLDLLDNDSTYIDSQKLYNYENDAFVFEIFNKFNISSFDIPSCINSQPLTTDCRPSICKVKAPFGEIYIKVKGFSDGQCKYIERVSGIDGINCSFPNNDLSSLQSLFNKRFELLANSSVTMAELEVKTLGDILSANCSKVSDYESSQIIDIDKTDHNLFDPEFSFEDLVKYTSNSLNKHIEITKSDVNEPYTADLANYRSIMFSSNEIDLMNLLLESFNTSLNKNSATVSKNSLGSFFINSILYIKPDTWSVWINNIKYSNDSPPSTITLDEVTSKRVKVSWKAGNLDRISPTWRTKLFPINNTKYISKQYDIVVQGSHDDLTISFALKSNQTFDITEMKIFEGSIY